MTIVRLIQMLHHLARDRGKRIFSLRDLAILSGSTRASVGMTLLRAQKKGLVFRIGNTWINCLDPPPLDDIGLALRSPSYISFESALYRHGILSQSPRGALVLATTRRPGRMDTPWGKIQFIHLKNTLFFGYDAHRVAHPEKAWLDLVYIRGRKGRREILTETFYLKGLNRRRLNEFGRRFPRWVRDFPLPKSGPWKDE